MHLPFKLEVAFLLQESKNRMKSPGSVPLGQHGLFWFLTPSTTSVIHADQRGMAAYLTGNRSERREAPYIASRKNFDCIELNEKFEHALVP